MLLIDGALVQFKCYAQLYANSCLYGFHGFVIYNLFYATEINYNMEWNFSDQEQQPFPAGNDIVIARANQLSQLVAAQ